VVLLAIYVFLATGPLVLRTFTIDDASVLLQLNNEPEVIKYRYDSFFTLQDANKVLEYTLLPQSALCNHGCRVVHLK
jgi:hypothetical protein